MLREQMHRALADAMEYAGVSQAELARRLGVSRAAVCQYLSPDRNLTLDTADRMFAAIGAGYPILSFLFDDDPFWRDPPLPTAEDVQRTLERLRREGRRASGVKDES